MPEHLAKKFYELPWSPHACDRIAEAARIRDEADALLEASIRECRHGDNPSSWAEIARMLGVRRQTAWKQYHHLDDSSNGRARLARQQGTQRPLTM
jgi:hypothetical protein